MATPNLLTSNTVFGNTNFLNVTTSSTSILENDSSSNKLYKVNTLLICNISQTTQSVNVSIDRSSSETKFISFVTISSGSTFSAIDKNSIVYLVEGDSLKLSSSNNDSLTAICSYEEIS